MFIVKGTIYPYDIMVYFGDIDKLKKILKGYNISIKGIEFSSKGNSLMFEGKQTLLWLKEEPKNIEGLALLQHEILHCVTFILEKVGIKYNNETDEVYAYLVQFVTKKIYKELKMFKK